MFQNCTALKKLILSDKVNLIQEYAFAGCTSLDTVRLPAALIKIRSSVFEGCSDLKAVYIRDKVTSIENSAFKGCSSLTAITIPGQIAKIDASAFEGCTALDSVTSMIEKPFAFGKDAFKDISPTCVLTVPYGRKDAYIAAGWTTQVFKGGIREMPAPEGIQPITVRKKDNAIWYDTDGIETAHPQKGKIYIHGGKKILVK